MTPDSLDFGVHQFDPCHFELSITMAKARMTFDEARAKISNYKAVIFDNDGTLVDSMGIHYVAWREALKPQGIEFSEDRFYALAGVPASEIISTLAQEQNKQSVSVSSVLESRQEHLEHHLKHVGKVDVVVRLLDAAVAGNIPVALASGGERGDVLASLMYAGIDATVFRSIVTREDIFQGKPDPEIFLTVAEKINIDPAQCIGLEDGDKGLQALDAAGMGKLDARLLEGYPLPKPLQKLF